MNNKEELEKILRKTSTIIDDILISYRGIIAAEHWGRDIDMFYAKELSEVVNRKRIMIESFEEQLSGQINDLESNLDGLKDQVSLEYIYEYINNGDYEFILQFLKIYHDAKDSIFSYLFRLHGNVIEYDDDYGYYKIEFEDKNKEVIREGEKCIEYIVGFFKLIQQSISDFISKHQGSKDIEIFNNLKQAQPSLTTEIEELFSDDTTYKRLFELAGVPYDRNIINYIKIAVDKQYIIIRDDHLQWVGDTKFLAKYICYLYSICKYEKMPAGPRFEKLFNIKSFSVQKSNVFNADGNDAYADKLVELLNISIDAIIHRDCVFIPNEINYPEKRKTKTNTKKKNM